MLIQSIPLSHLIASEQPRPLLTAQVDLLASSIKQIGLIQPITVTPTTVLHGIAEPGWRIVAGHHRVAAVRALGWTEVDAIVIDNERNLQNELVEIDENLCRAELTATQRTAYTKRRKQIWEALHPVKTDMMSDLGEKIGQEQFSESGQSLPTLSKSKTGRGNVQFAAATAKATGQAKRTTNLALHRAEALGDAALTKIAGTSLDSGVQMDALIQLPVEQRETLIDRAAAGEKVSAKQDAAQATAPATAAQTRKTQASVASAIRRALRGVLNEFDCMAVEELIPIIKEQNAQEEVQEIFEAWSKAVYHVDIMALVELA